MDPNATVDIIVANRDSAEPGDIQEHSDALLNLRDWLRRGGFKPGNAGKLTEREAGFVGLATLRALAAGFHGWNSGARR